ncbi:hypothetical protein K2O51_23170 [Cupriavidus pinatubonensis]|uniref:hypothetical protein n=1 Tax=Cupriavidus pinatubonensis TaxID=248026 RepID=UPI001C73A325|nr:hypothetical protein [Cupriavidus pinatubonensis]QYY30275.1 hypothetical protein K2O51_23170 [Cupriavidus pinatubonensis]
MDTTHELRAEIAALHCTLRNLAKACTIKDRIDALAVAIDDCYDLCEHMPEAEADLVYRAMARCCAAVAMMDDDC